MLGGMAINTTGTVLVHGMGYYLTNYHDVHHGLANSVLLPYVLRFEGDCIGGKLLKIAANLGLRDASGLLDHVEVIADEIGIPRSLSDLGVKASELESMVSDAMSYSRNLVNNPVSVTEKEVRDIYARALNGRR